MIWATLGQIETIDGFDAVAGAAQYGLIPAAALAAYRLSAKAYTDAADVAKETAQTFRQQLADERGHFETSLAIKDARIRELEVALLKARYPPKQPPEETPKEK